MKTAFHIEEKQSIRVVGYFLETTNQKGEARKAIPAFWSAIQKDHLDKNLLAMAKDSTQGLFGIHIYQSDPYDTRKFTYMIAVASDHAVQGNLFAYTIPARTWAIFPCTKKTIGKTEAQAITKWLPKSKYKPLNKGYITGRMKAGAPDIEYYHADGNVEVWIAVQEKKGV
ncbi:GyrI-like domain-containing protein [Longicatena caecimuris]|uniref:Putative transcriptional regulator YdeE n=1 Tax=Longicatena caecimuris TaxID=1796635 RepID=A0A4R3TN28_9FIRM|nr:effector binding domain-containing protein [Longicatena caecimuris]MCR1869279.1 effector binding domain-containing protein [Longicatena caecimuris]MCU0101799.1 effector binding domain-containing protein [Longicatena caecimuris]TCU63026.1 putative transcriptional regulator YdeE [Longicatena caecimuris]